MNMDCDTCLSSTSCGQNNVCSGCDMSDMMACKPDPCCDFLMPQDLCPDLPLAQAYVRPQPYARTLSACDGLKAGTIFRDLVSKYK